MISTSSLILILVNSAFLVAQIVGLIVFCAVVATNYEPMQRYAQAVSYVEKLTLHELGKRVKSMKYKVEKQLHDLRGVIKNNLDI